MAQSQQSAGHTTENVAATGFPENTGLQLLGSAFVVSQFHRTAVLPPLTEGAAGPAAHSLLWRSFFWIIFSPEKKKAFWKDSGFIVLPRINFKSRPNEQATFLINIFGKVVFQNFCFM